MDERDVPVRQKLGQAVRNPSLTLSRVVPGRVYHLLEAFWFVPLGCAVLGVAGPVAFQLVPERSLALFFGGDNPQIDVDGARATLQVVAGGVITITSLVFSLAFIALTITAQQLSPRVLDYVVEERVTQLLVGLSLATFLFSAITLSFGITGGELRLAVSSYLALVLAAATIGIVVVFSHRMTQILRAEDMVVWLGRTFARAAAEGPASISEAMMVSDPEAEAELEARLAGARTVYATRTGYLGAVDYPGLLAWAEENDLCVQILDRENAFVLERQACARVAGVHGGLDDVAERITDYLNLTERRVIGETPEYEASSLTEVALRALSPAINDPATARSCANRLYHGMVLVATLPERPRALKGSDGVGRILRARHGIPDFLEDNVAPIVEAAHDRTTLRHLRELNETLAGIARRPDELAAIEAMARRIAAADPPPERHLEPGPRAGAGSTGAAPPCGAAPTGE